MTRLSDLIQAAFVARGATPDPFVAEAVRALDGIVWTDEAIRRITAPKSVYLIGSLRNDYVPTVAHGLRLAGWDVFDDWYAAGPRADDHWQEYEQERGHTFIEALDGHAARHVHEYDKSHLDRCDIGVLVLPAGKSGHLELGYMAGQGKPVFILLDKEPERYDVMYRFATVVPNLKALAIALEGTRN